MLAPVPNDAVLSLSWPCIIVAMKIVGVADASYFILFYSVAIINPLAFNVQYVHMYNVYLGFKKWLNFILTCISTHLGLASTTYVAYIL